MNCSTDINDQELIDKSLQGHADAYRLLVERYQARIASQMHRFSRDTLVVEDLVQDVFVQAYLGLRGFNGRAPFIHWLGRIATRVGYRHWKLLKRRADQDASLADHLLPSLERNTDEWSRYEAGDMLYKLFEKLSPPDRLVLTLHYWDGYATDEIALRTGWTRAGVKVRLFRARNRLKSILEKHA